MRSIGAKLETWAAQAAHLLFALAVFSLLLLSGLFTCRLVRGETTMYTYDSVFLNLLTVVLALAVGTLALRLWRKTADRHKAFDHLRFQRFCLWCVLGLGILWVLATQHVPNGDQRGVWQAVLEFRHGTANADFRHLRDYLVAYPHQAGLVCFYYLLGNVVGDENWVVAQLLNVLALVCVYRSILRLEEDAGLPQRARSLTAALAVGFLPMLLYVSFVYGNLYGLALALLAMEREARFFRTQKVVDLVLTTLFISLAVVMKSNYLIALVVLLILAGLELLGRKRLAALALAAAMGVGTWSISALPKAFLAQKTGLDLDRGCVSLAWVAMGLQESPKRTAGWYNEYNWNSYIESGMDPAVQSAMVKEDLTRSLEGFYADPDYAVNFFARKNASQWAEPTFQSFCVQTRDGPMEQSNLLRRFLSLPSEARMIGWLDRFQFAVYAGALLWLALGPREEKRGLLGLEIYFLGGFLFHTFWEAKSQYVLFHFLPLLALAAAGYSRAADCLARWTASPHPASQARAALKSPGWVARAAVLAVALVLCLSAPLARPSLGIADESATYWGYVAHRRMEAPPDGTYTISPARGGGFLTADEENVAALRAEPEVILLEDRGSGHRLRLTDRNYYCLGALFHSAEEEEIQSVLLSVPTDYTFQQWYITPTGEPDLYFLKTGNQNALTYDLTTGQIIVTRFTGAKTQQWRLSEVTPDT